MIRPIAKKLRCTPKQKCCSQGAGGWVGKIKASIVPFSKIGHQGKMQSVEAVGAILHTVFKTQEENDAFLVLAGKERNLPAC